MKMLGGLARISLLWKFAIVNLVPILLLGWSCSTTSTAGFRSARSPARRRPHSRSRAARSSGNETLGRPELRSEVRGISVWNPSLRVVYSQSRSQIGRRIFPLSNEHRSVLNGHVVSSHSGRNLEVYVPLWLGRGRQPEGAVQLVMPTRRSKRPSAATRASGRC